MENLQTPTNDPKFERWMKATVEGIAEGESPFGAVIIDNNGSQAHFQVYGPVLELDCTALLINHPGNRS